MDQTYYDTITQLEESRTNQDYILGWASGYQGTPMREEQRVTEAYEAGYKDGESRSTEAAANWQAG